MNDINELIEIIQSLGGNATTGDIVSKYCQIHHMIEQPHFKRIVERTLSSHRKKIRHNKANYKWEYKTEDEVEYILVSDNRYFASIRDAMLYIFNKSVPLSRGYFQVDDDHMAWFPQPKNDNWENVLSDDGRFWFEKPKTANADYEADNKLRYVFVHEKKGYRFTGLFKVGNISDDKTRIYELVDDKVARVKPRPYLIVCRVAYMKNYNGITKDDVPVNGGKYVVENKDAAEKYNFHRYDDGNCYIYVETKYKNGYTAENSTARSIVIENINPLCKGKELVEGVRVVLTAISPILNKNVIVGWYDNVTIYRNRVVDTDKTYMMKCLYDDSHLIPENERSFEVPGARGNQYGIGQSNYWYIQNNNAAREYEEKLNNYLNDLPF